MKRFARSAAVATVTVMTLGAALTGCGSSNSNASDQKSIKVWSLENQTDRFTKTQATAKAFTTKTGIKVDLQAVDEAQLPQLVAQAAQAGTLPDVIGGVSLASVRQFDTQKLLDTATAAAVIKDLGESTFASSAIKLTKDGDRQLAVPSDAWSQILVYRKDLFAAAGLAPPINYDALEKAAGALTKPGQFGITLSTDPADVFTSQTFESLALGNNCQLVDDAGAVALKSPACSKTFQLYQKLATQDSPKGTQTVDTTRESYFAGQSAIVIWSTFLLDELGGLRNDALPTCPQCKADKTWLAKNSGVVTAVTGPDGKSSGSFGEIGSWTAMSGGKADPGKQFIEYMMSAGYTDWLGLAPEGKFPARNGDATDPQKYVNAWKKLPAGVDVKKPLSDIYDAATMTQISSVNQHIDRWAIPEGQGALLGPTIAELPLPKIIAKMDSSGLGAANAATQAQAAVEKVQKALK